MIRKLSRTAVALTAAAVGVLSAAPMASAAPVKTPTSFALAGSGFAAKVEGGSLPAGIGKVAFADIGCTNYAGLHHDNSAASLNLPGLGTIKGAQTRTFTMSNTNGTSEWSIHTIASLDLLDLGGLGSLSLDGIKSITHAYNNSSGYHATATSSLGSITLTLLGIPTQLPVPPVGQTLTIPGLAEISLGAGTTHVTSKGASAYDNAVKLVIIPTGTTIYLAHAQSKITGGVRSALFRGGAYGADANAVGGAIKLGKTPNLVMPCRGTGGHVKSNSTASVNIPGVAEIDGITTSELGKSTTSTASMYGDSQIAEISLAGGALVIDGIEGHASAALKNGVVTTSTDGTTILSITLNGQQESLPPGGQLTLPGIATLSSDVTKQLTNGVSVISLQIQLLDGSGATINLGYAKAQIQPSGL